MKQRVAAIRVYARARMRKDIEIYLSEALQEIGQLYQAASHKWRSEEGKMSLEKLLEKHDNADKLINALKQNCADTIDRRVRPLLAAVDKQ